MKMGAPPNDATESTSSKHLYLAEGKEEQTALSNVSLSVLVSESFALILVLSISLTRQYSSIVLLCSRPSWNALHTLQQL